VVDEVDRLVDLIVVGDVEQFKAQVVPVLEVPDAVERAGLQVCHADHPLPARQQVVAEAGAKEAGTACDERRGGANAPNERGA
jgi:hypothetical protein